MPEIAFHITKEIYENELTWDGEAALQKFSRGEPADMDQAKELLVPFMTNGEGVPLDADEARRIIGRLPKKHQAKVVAEFSKALLDFLVPKVSETASTKPSGTAEAAPDGLPTS